MEQESEERRFYRVSLWWVEHRAGLFKLLLAAFAAFDAALILFALWTFTDSFLIRIDAERGAVVAMATRGQDDLHAFTVGTAGAPLGTSPVVVLPSVAGKNDLYATVENPNADWLARFTYRFRAGAFETEPQRGFALPATEKPLIAFAVKGEGSLQGAQLVIDDLRWERVDKRFTGDYQAFLADRLRFSFEDVAFVTDAPAGGTPVARVGFTVKNGSAYGYYDPAFVVLLKRGPAVVGVTRTTLSQIAPGEARRVDITWAGPIPSVSQASVLPDIDLFDEGVYLPVGQ